ncbi:MAG: hypothetical protein P8J32_00270 [bacterium]|nr:hypothetical protein [bacterium]
MVTRNEVKQDVLSHFYSLDAEPTMDGVEFADIDGLGLKILAAIGITSTFVGTPIKQFDRVYQFTIKYEKTDITSNLTDSALLKETDIEAFLDICKKNNMALGIIDGISPAGSISLYCKDMVVRGRLENFLGMHEKSNMISGQPILSIYKSLRKLHSKSTKNFTMMADAVADTNNFSISFRRMMKTLGKMSRHISTL